MLIRTSFVCAVGFCAVLTLTQPAAHAQSIINEQNAAAWGIENSELNILPGSIITQAALTLHNASFISTSGSEAVYVHLLDNPDADIVEYTDSETGDYFEDSGVYLAQFNTSDLPASPSDITFELGQISDASSAIWAVFGQPFTITTFPTAVASQVSYSSALLELLDYAGTGRSFGFGLDCDEFAFSGMTLELTIESMSQSTPSETTVAFTVGQTSPNTYTLTTTAANGTITQSPNKATYSYGEAVTLTAVADAGYTFTGWSGDATGTSASVTVTMDGNKSVTAGFSDTNQAPLLNPIEDINITEKDRLDFTVTATDPDGDPVTITAEGLPDGATFDGSVFRWRPWYGDAGTYEVHFTASDGNQSATITVTITVQPIKLRDWYAKWIKHLRN